MCYNATNMQTVSIKDLRNNLAQYIDEVAIANKQFEVTKFGKARARIIPILEKKTKPAENKGIVSSFGAWKGRKDIKNPSRWANQLRKRMSTRYENIFG